MISSSVFLFVSDHKGNKCDLEQLREVRKEEAAALAKQYNMIESLETSAKDNTNVDEAFLKIAKVSAEKQGRTTSVLPNLDHYFIIKYSSNT